MVAVGGVHHDVAQGARGVALDHVDGADDAAPASPIALVVRPSTPELSSSFTRIVRRYCALGVALTAGLPPWLAARHLLKRFPRKLRAKPRGAARRSVPRFAWPARRAARWDIE